MKIQREFSDNRVSGSSPDAVIFERHKAVASVDGWISCLRSSSRERLE